MPGFLKVAQGINTQHLQQALDTHAHLFGRITLRSAPPGGPHKEMTDIWVRYNDITKYTPNDANFCTDISDFNDEHDSVWYPAYHALPELKPILFWMMGTFEGERLGGILITKLPPGGKIQPHVDGGWHAKYYEKFYVAVKTPKGSVFGFNDGNIEAQDGDIYWFDNSVPHWVHNDTAEDRIAMIVCIKTDMFKGLKDGDIGKIRAA
jgi:quercetin dioxygenase-like cupin family protein